METGIPVMSKSLNVFIEEMTMVYNIEKNGTDGQIIGYSSCSSRTKMICSFQFELPLSQRWHSAMKKLH